MQSLRIGLEGKHKNQPFYRYGDITIGSEWKMFEYQINDLPLADLGPLTIRFEHTGRGNVWLDDWSFLIFISARTSERNFLD